MMGPWTRYNNRSANANATQTKESVVGIFQMLQFYEQNCLVDGITSSREECIILRSKIENKLRDKNKTSFNEMEFIRLLCE